MSGDLPLADLSRLANIVGSLSPVQLEAWLRCGHRMGDGMPVHEAEALMWAELAEAEEA